MKLFLTILSIIFLLAACDTQRKKAAMAGIQYTCPMHPQVLKDEAGECPICHMDLVPSHQYQADTMHHEIAATDSLVNAGDSSNDMDMNAAEEIELTAEQVLLANIQTDTIGSTGFGNSMVLTGTVTLNEKEIETVSARVKGRVERLYHKNTGDYVGKGTRLYELYSEELNSAKQEYILLLQRRGGVGNTVIDFNQLVEAARHKLILWGMTPTQIKTLEHSRKTSYTTTFYSTASGFIKELNVTEGAYVMEGQSMVRLANTSSVWVETQAYTSQLSRLSRNAAVTVQLPELDNKKVNGTIEFASPEINQQSRINLLRVNIPNPGNQLKPGMVAYIYLNSPQRTTISLPGDAVLRDNNIARVWVKTGKTTFALKKLTIGAENGNSVEVLSGLKRGDVVVISGAYLLNSEYLLRNGYSTMSGM